MAYTELYCQNPQCGAEINGNEIAYDGRKPYHPRECQIFAVAHLAREYERGFMIRFESIKRKEALRLLREGKLEQKIKVKSGFFSRLISADLLDFLRG